MNAGFHIKSTEIRDLESCSQLSLMHPIDSFRLNFFFFFSDFGKRNNKTDVGSKILDGFFFFYPADKQMVQKINRNIYVCFKFD